MYTANIYLSMGAAVAKVEMPSGEQYDLAEFEKFVISQLE
jgi:hypothetical protein